MNRLKTLMLLATLTALLLWAGQALAGQGGVLVALLVAGLMNFGAYWWSDTIVLRLYGAQEVSEAEASELYRLVRHLAQRAAIPMPRIYLIPEEVPNAFATGRSPQHAAVAVTEGLMRRLSRAELGGVLAHELGHIQRRNTLIMTVAAALAGVLSMLANLAMFSSLLGGGRQDTDEGDGSSSPLGGLVGLIVAPFAAMLLQMAISRSREFLADETSARLTDDPLALANALRKIATWSQQLPMTAGSPATAHLFIINPISGGGMLRLFSTHPPLEARIERLEDMARRNRHAVPAV